MHPQQACLHYNGFIVLRMPQRRQGKGEQYSCMVVESRLVQGAFSPIYDSGIQPQPKCFVSRGPCREAEQGTGMWADIPSKGAIVAHNSSSSVIITVILSQLPISCFLNPIIFGDREEEQASLWAQLSNSSQSVSYPDIIVGR